MKIHEILLEEKFRDVIGNSKTGKIKLEYDLDPVTKKYSGKFSIAYINTQMANFYSLKNGRILGIDNMGHNGKVEMHCHLRNRYLALPNLNHVTYPMMLDMFIDFIVAIKIMYKRDKSK